MNFGAILRRVYLESTLWLIRYLLKIIIVSFGWNEGIAKNVETIRPPVSCRFSNRLLAVRFRFRQLFPVAFGTVVKRVCPTGV